MFERLKNLFKKKESPPEVKEEIADISQVKNGLLREVYKGKTDAEIRKGIQADAEVERKGREAMCQIADSTRDAIPKDEFYRLQNELEEVVLPKIFEEIKRGANGERVGLWKFMDIIEKIETLPFSGLATSQMEMYASYNYWLEGRKLYKMHPNLCARFTATTIKDFPVPIEFMELPFPAFKMLLPPKALEYETFEKKTIDIKEITVVDFFEEKLQKRQLLVFHRTGEDIGYFRMTIDEDEVHKCVEKSVKEMMAYQRLEKKNEDDEIEFNERHQKEMLNIFEFVMKSILYITGANADVKFLDETQELKTRLSRAKTEGNKKEIRRRLDKAKKCYLVGHNIILSRAEREIYDNVAKGIWKLSHRIMVQGHYKWQPHGEGWKQRKRIYVDPYPRGPEFSELVNNPHLVK